MKIRLSILLLMLIIASINILGINGRKTQKDAVETKESTSEEDKHASDKSNTDNDDQSEETIDKIGTAHKIILATDSINGTHKPIVIASEQKKEARLIYENPETGVTKNKTEEKKSKESSPKTSAETDNNTIHISGNIALVKHRSSISDSLLYKFDNTLLKPKNVSFSKYQITFSENYIGYASFIQLYVSTKKAVDRKLAFSKYVIKVKRDRFPISFRINVKLPNQTQGDVTLYLFAYVKYGDNYLDAFIPAGTSRIYVHNSNELTQKIDVYVKANGTEINGAFVGRYGHRYVEAETTLQVFILPEYELGLRYNQTFQSVAKLNIKKVPPMYPISFSLSVLNHLLNPTQKYYAIASITENGTRRLINQQPILVFNRTKTLVKSKITFNVVPSPFSLFCTIVRSMPGPSVLQPHSTLVLRFHEINSEAEDLTLSFNGLLMLPQNLQVNISQLTRFDPSKSYDISAYIMDEQNTTYMASSEKILLNDDYSKFVIPLDDLIYYINVRLQPPGDENMPYIPGSTALIFITENPGMLTKPIVALHIDSIPEYFNEFSFQLPAKSIQNDRDYYLVLIIEVNGIITHVTKSLLNPNRQPPPLLFQLPVPKTNRIRGQLFDIDNHPAQWSSSSSAVLILLDDSANNYNNAIVQVWKIQLDKDFPVQFEIELDFGHLRTNHVYRLQAAIETQHKIVEYETAGSVLVVNPYGGIISDVRIPLRNVKQFQAVQGIIYMDGINGPLPLNSEIILQISSSPSLTKSNILNETRFRVDGRYLPINFTMYLPLNRIDINSVYHIFAQYVIQKNVIVPASQTFPFVPRNDKPIVLLLSKTPQILITGQVTSRNNSLILPKGSLIHLYITNDLNQTEPNIYSEVFLQASSNNVYGFRMTIDADIVNNKIPIYLHTEILYNDQVIVTMPKSVLLQIASVGEWDIDLKVDLPTLLIGYIVSAHNQEIMHGDLDAHIQIIDRNTTTIVQEVQLPAGNNLPVYFRIELGNDLFVRYSTLQARAFIKNCKGQIIFDADDTVDIHNGLNIDLELPIVLFDRKKLNQLQRSMKNNVQLHTGVWNISVTGVVTDAESGTITTVGKNYVIQ